MAFFTIERTGYDTVSDMMLQVIEDMTDNGFSVLYPLNYVPSSRSETLPLQVILQATTEVDPLAETQPWVIAIRIQTEESCFVNLITPTQVLEDGKISAVKFSPVVETQGLITPDNPAHPNTGDWYAGSVGKLTTTLDEKYTPTTPANSKPLYKNLYYESTDKEIGFINRSGSASNATTRGGRPLNYRLTIAPHGMFLGAYEGNYVSTSLTESQKNLFNWFVVQRPVNKNTGAPLITGKCPVFCVSCVANTYRHFVVRESDIPHPSIPVVSTEYTEDSFKIINDKQQISITEDKKYVVSFIHNLNTPRFRYEEELDLIAVVSADILIQGIDVQFQAYGASRTYYSMPANKNFNTGARILALKQL